MGSIYPKNSKICVYVTFPIGTRKAHGASGRFGATFLRFIIDTFPIFQGDPVNNSVMAYFTKKVYYLEHEEGHVLVDA